MEEIEDAKHLMSDHLYLDICNISLETWKQRIAKAQNLENFKGLARFHKLLQCVRITRKLVKSFIYLEQLRAVPDRQAVDTWRHTECKRFGLDLSIERTEYTQDSLW